MMFPTQSFGIAISAYSSENLNVEFHRGSTKPCFCKSCSKQRRKS